MSNQCLRPPSIMKLKRKKFAKREEAASPYLKETSKAVNKKPSSTMTTVNPFKSKSQNLFDLKTRSKSETDRSLYDQLSKPSFQKTKSLDLGYVLPTEVTTKSQDRVTERERLKTVPLDWSLKTEYRVTSNSPFKWCTGMKAADEADVTNTFSSSHLISEEKQAKVKLQCSLSHWIYPNVPWLKIFPRDIISASKSDQTTLKQDAVSALLRDWESSFESLFGMLKFGECPYFYLCSKNTTVLFRAREGGKEGIVHRLQAHVVPTTLGVRNSLKQEDIEYTMPLAETNSEYDMADAAADGEDAKEFLDSIGIDSSRYSKLNTNSVERHMAEKQNLDTGIRSMVRVEGTHVQGLFNYLLNDRSLTPTVGELAGVPPTLLSPTVFSGACIRRCQIKCGSSLSRQPDGMMAVVYYLNITGPLLPSSLQQINALLSTTQDSFSGKLSAVHGTGVFNTPTSSGESRPADGVDRGDTTTVTPSDTTPPIDTTGDHVTIHEVEWTEGGFMVK